MGPRHVIIEGGSGVRHGESEPVVVDLESFVQIQVILLLNGYPFLDLPLCPVSFPYQDIGFFPLDVVA